MSKFSVNLEVIEEFDISLSYDLYNINNYDNPNFKPLKFDKISYYYPTLKIFNDNNLESSTGSIYSLNTEKQIINYKTIYDKKLNQYIEKDIFFKFAPLLDPTRYMIGKYQELDEQIYTLPSIKDSSISKYSSFYNASYTDNFACFIINKLLHNHNFIHGIEYYGSFLTIQNKYRIDVVDELDYLFESDYFKNNLDKKFYLDNKEQFEFLNYGSRSNKPKINISKTNKNVTISSLNIEHVDTFIDDVEELVYESNNKNKSISQDQNNANLVCSDNDNDDDDDDDNSLENLSDEENNDNQNNDNDSEDNKYDQNEEYDSDDDDDDDDDNDDDSDDSEDETPVYCYIDNFPIQVISIEKCNGTFDKLLSKDEVDIDIARSILFQIIMILITYQKCFHLTHNDLHTNNIMYVNTNIKYLYYKFNNNYYKVPTFGKIIKIIDYGRSIYKFNGNLFCSDSYSPGGDAHTQYNTEPFMDENKARLDPNYSFDLCRLGCSIYDFIIDQDEPYDSLDDFQKIIVEWCSDDNDKNILYKKNGDERYPNFKLYKMIARTVHRHTPEAQLEKSFFQLYVSSKKNVAKKQLFNIDDLPVYI